MKSYEAEATIDAGADEVWAVLVWRSMPDLQPSFDKFASGLKERVEGSS